MNISAELLENKTSVIIFDIFAEGCQVCSLFGVASSQPYNRAPGNGSITFTPYNLRAYRSKGPMHIASDD